MCCVTVQPIYLGLWLNSHFHEYQTNICRMLRWQFLLHSRQTPSSEIYEVFLLEEEGNLQGMMLELFLCSQTFIKRLWLFFQECIGGTFGEDCQKSCGQCKNSRCNPVTGECDSTGCNTGYIGASCFNSEYTIIW